MSKTTSFTYNHADAVKTVMLPGIPGMAGSAALPATTLTYSYGRNGLFESVVDGTRTLGAASYDTLGRPLGLWSGVDANDPDRVNRSFTWFVRDLVKTQSVAVGPSSSEATQLSYAYDYDSMGTPVRVSGTRPGSEAAWCYSYDGINRLTRARTGVPVAGSKDCAAAANAVVEPVTGANYDLSYGFDQARLKTVKAGASGPEVTYSYADAAHPHAATGLAEPAHATAPGLPSQGALAYDAGGRAATWAPHGEPVVNYAYDVQGNLVRSEDTATGGLRSVYAYDADGIRLVRKTGDQTVLYLGDTEITTTTDGTTTTRSSRRIYTAPGGTPLAVQETNGGAVEWTYVFGDGQDSIRYGRSNQTNAGSYFFYAPYGDPIGDPALPGGRGFLNKAHDPDGTVRLDHRSYDGGLNVFATPDPILRANDPMTLNPYAYARSNPVALADPSGLEAAPPCYRANNCGPGQLDCEYNGECVTGAPTPAPVIDEGIQANTVESLTNVNEQTMSHEKAHRTALRTALNQHTDWDSVRTYMCYRYPDMCQGSGNMYVEMAKLASWFVGGGAVGKVTVVGGRWVLGRFFGGVAASAGSKFGKLTHSSTGIAPYSAQRMVTQGHGGAIQAHHLIEKRFAAVMGQNTADMSAIVVTRAEHQVFTNAWRQAIPYGSRNVTPNMVNNAARNIYRDYPEILQALGLG